jgi:predicted protein tyrosine phosphatase
MRWKCCLSTAGSDGTERLALEDLYLIPDDGSSGGRSYWVTVEALQSFTGGTREEKLERLAGKEFDISDTMDMLVHREDFDRAELLGWARVFIQNRLGDPLPELVEADGEEASRYTPVIRENEPHVHDNRPAQLLFVHHRSGPSVVLPEASLNGAAGLEISSLCLDDVQTADLPADRISRADLVFVMDKRTSHMLQRRCKALGVQRRIACLFLPEHHDVRDPAFQALFAERVRVYLDRFGWSRNDRE